MAIRLFQCSSAARLSGQRPAPVPIRHHFNRSTLGPFNPSALQPFPPWPRPALVAGLQPTPAATNVPRWATATMPGTSGPVLSRCARSRAAPPAAQGGAVAPRNLAAPLRWRLGAQRGRWPRRAPKIPDHAGCAGVKSSALRAALAHFAHVPRSFPLPRIALPHNLRVPPQVRPIARP